MGREIQCRAKSGGKWLSGKALLETHELIFRGDAHLTVPLGELTSVVARNGELHLKWPGKKAVFELGEQAEKWAHAILHPKSTIDKLAIKPGLRISAVHMPSDGVVNHARDAAAEFSDGRPLKNSDVIFYQADAFTDLSKAIKVVPSLASNGALWIVYPKGSKEITELQVLNAGRAAGLVDIKVVSYSDTHTTLKFVRPKNRR